MRELVDDAVILCRKAIAENVDVLTLLTASHGVVAGALRGQRNGAEAAPGNRVRLTHTARRPEHELGRCEIELLEAPAARALSVGRTALAGLQTVCDAAASYLPNEVELPEDFFEQTVHVLRAHAHGRADALSQQTAFDVRLPVILGYDVGEACFSPGCAAVAAFISPRTGRAACAEHGAPWCDRLWPVPRLLSAEAKPANDVTADDVAAVRRLLTLRYRQVPRFRRVGDPGASRAAYYDAVMKGLTV